MVSEKERGHVFGVSPLSMRERIRLTTDLFSPSSHLRHLKQLIPTPHLSKHCRSLASSTELHMGGVVRSPAEEPAAVLVAVRACHTT